MKNTLLNQKIKIIPDVELDAFEGIIIIVKEPDVEQIIIKVITPFYYRDDKFEFLLASPRHEGNTFMKLLRGEAILCAMLKLSLERINSKNPFDTSWWRGGGSFIGDVAPL